MDSSGLTVILETGLVVSGSKWCFTNENGKNYSRAMTCHKIVLLLKYFLDKHGECMVFSNLPDTFKERLSQISNSPSKQSLECGQSDQHILAYIDQYNTFCNETRNGSLCETAQFQAAYIEHVWLMLGAQW